MELEPIKIKLKECCLTCENYYPDGIASYSLCGTNSREISCLHMCVCYKYLLESEKGEDHEQNLGRD